MNLENIKLDPYEQEIEDNLEKAKRVENFNEWKELVERAAAETVKKLEKRKVRFTLEVSSPELKEEAIKVLKERFGEKLKVVEV
jgi:predicted DNA binding CopG/RHH family protein